MPYQWKGKAQLWKKILKMHLKPSSPQSTWVCKTAMKQVDCTRKTYCDWKKHHRLFYQNPLMKDKAFGHHNQWSRLPGCSESMLKRDLNRLHPQAVSFSRSPVAQAAESLKACPVACWMSKVWRPCMPATKCACFIVPLVWLPLIHFRNI